MCSCQAKRRATELLRDKNGRACRSALKVLKACNASERAPYMARVGKILCDKDWRVRRSALEMLKTCEASERAPHMARVGELLHDEAGDVRRSAGEVLKGAKVASGAGEWGRGGGPWGAVGVDKARYTLHFGTNDISHACGGKGGGHRPGRHSYTGPF